MRKPFYKISHQAWYCQLPGVKRDGTPTKYKNTLLVRGPKAETKDAAEKKYHELMAAKPAARKARNPGEILVKHLVDQFLVWTKENRPARTYKWYYGHLQSFWSYLETNYSSNITVDDLTPLHVEEWLKTCRVNKSKVVKGLDQGADTKKTGQQNSVNYINGAARGVARCFNWACKKQILPSSPVKGFERPAYKPREEYLKPEQWQQVVNAIGEDDPFLDVAWFLYDSGARPQEMRGVTAADFEHLSRKLILTRENSKGGRDRRVIRLEGRAFEIVSRLALKYREGVLFRNCRGKAWTAYAIGNRFRRLSEKTGVSLCAYAIRHGYVTAALTRHVDPLTVAALCGHKNAKMIMEVYSHLCENDEHMAAAARKAIGEDAA